MPYSTITDDQIAAVLEWKRNYRTLRDWARQLNVPHWKLERAIINWRDPETWLQRMRCYPDSLPLNQMLPLIQWWGSRKSQFELGAELGLSLFQIQDILKRGGIPRLRVGDKPRCPAAERRALKEAECRKLREQNAARFRAHLYGGAP